MKKGFAILISLILCLNLCAAASAEGDWTIFVYLCGSDLESEYAFASDNMQEMIDACTGSNVRFVVETGGACAWNNGVSADTLDRYAIAVGRRDLVARQPLAGMGEAETLADFLRWGLAAYPAAHVGLVLWNHGSGSINGVCFDELADDESLSLKDIENALQSVQGLLPQGFDFIGFDACLMGTVETAAMLAPHARFMVSSQETEPGSGWNYAAIGRYLYAHPYADGAELGRAICDSYYQNCCMVEQEDGATLAVIDLRQIGALRAAFDAYAKDLLAVTEGNADYGPIARAVADADNFGGNNRSEGFTNMVDLGGLILAGQGYSSHTSDALAALNASVLYQVRGMDHDGASGLSIYYPLEVQGSTELGIFKDVCISPYYLELANKVAYGFVNGGNWDGYSSGWDADWDSAAQQGQSSAISFDIKPYLDEDGTYAFALTQDSIRNTESVEAVVYLVAPDGRDYICFGFTSDILGDWESGVFLDNFDGYWFALPDGQPLCVYLVDRRDGYDIFTSPVSVNGRETNLRFAWDYTTGEVRVMDLWDGVGAHGVASRPGETLKPGDRIVPLYDAYSAASGEDFRYTGGAYAWGFGDTLYFELLPDGDYLYSFCINDIYGGSYVTDSVSFSVYGDQIMYNTIP